MNRHRIPLNQRSERLAAETVSRLLRFWILILGLFLVPAWGGVHLLAADSDQVSQSTARWLGPDGSPLPFQTDEEALEFLRTARKVKAKRVGEGITNPWKILLEKDGVRAHAVFRDIRFQKDKRDARKGTLYNFRDDARFEVAAYKLSRMLGLDNIPPVVERRLMSKPGTLQLWIENALSEKNRYRQDLMPEDTKLFRLQTQIMRVFDNLIANEDRNQGNILYDSSWKLWLIDHTRAFRPSKDLYSPNTIRSCEEGLWEHLRNLDKTQVKRELKKYLYPTEMKGLLARRDLLIEHFERLIEKRGAEIVLFDLPAGAADQRIAAAP